MPAVAIFTIGHSAAAIQSGVCGVKREGECFQWKLIEAISVNKS